MGNVFGVQQRQGIGHRHAVITAQGGTPGKNVRAIVGQVQAVVLKVNGAVRFFFANHVHVTLQNHRGMVFIARRSRLKDHHIVPLVLLEAKPPILGKPDQIVTDGFGIPGAVGNGTNFLKKTKHARRFQTGQRMLFHKKHSLFLQFFVLMALFYHVNPILSSRSLRTWQQHMISPADKLQSATLKTNSIPWLHRMNKTKNHPDTALGRLRLSDGIMDVSKGSAPVNADPEPAFRQSLRCQSGPHPGNTPSYGQKSPEYRRAWPGREIARHGFPG